MGKVVAWIIIVIIILLTVIMTFLRTPEQISSTLGQIAAHLANYSLFVHVLFVVILILGLAIKKARNDLFALFMAFIALSATVVAITNKVFPNVLAFGLIFILIAYAYLARRLNFDFGNLKGINILFAVIGLVFGFWYLHWTNSPVWLNAIVYSPMGVLNCPTLLTLGGFLCLAARPRSVAVESVVAFFTLYFGFFGLLIWKVWADSFLIVTALFLLIRISSLIRYEVTFEHEHSD